MDENVVYNISTRDNASPTLERVATLLEELLSKQKNLNKEAEKAATDTSGAIEKGFDLESLGKRITDFVKAPLENMKGGMLSLVESMGPVAVGITAIGGAAIAAGAGIFKFASEAADALEQLDNLAATSGFTVDQLKAMQQIAAEAGLGGMNFGRTFAMLNRQIASGGSDIVKILNSMKYAAGETAVDTGNGLLPILDELQEKLQGVMDKTLQTELANKAFGIRLRDMIPLLLNSKQKFSEMIDEQIKQGISWDEDTKKRLRILDEFMDTMGRWAEIVKTKMQVLASYVGEIVLAMERGIKMTGDKFAPPPAPITDEDKKKADEENRKKEMEKAKKDLKDAFNQFNKITTPDYKNTYLGDPAELAEKELARIKMIASGDKENLDLKLKIQEAERVFGKLVADNNVKEAEAQATKLAALREEMKAREELKKTKKDEEEYWLQLRVTIEKTYKETFDFVSKQYNDMMGLFKEIKTQFGDVADEAWKRFHELKPRGEAENMKPDESSHLEMPKGGIIGTNAGTTKDPQQNIVGMQVSTIFTDFVRNLANASSAADGFHKALTSAGEMLKRFFLEMALKPLQSFLDRLLTGGSRGSGSNAGGIFGSVLSTGGGGSSSGGGGLFSSIKSIFTGGKTPSKSPMELPLPTTGLQAMSAGAGGQTMAIGTQSIVGAGTTATAGAAGAAKGAGGMLSGFGQAFGGKGAMGKFGKTAGGQAAAAGMMIGGSMLMSDAWNRGGVGGAIEGMGGGAMMGFSIGGPIGAAIGAAVGGIIGAFGGGEARRERERKMIAEKQGARMFNNPSAIAESGVFGMEGGYFAEADLTGRLQSRSGGNQTTINLSPIIKQLDPNDLDPVQDKITKMVAQAVITPGNQLADNIRFASGY